jgi:hypothetical protein
VATRVRVRAGLRYDLSLDPATDRCRLSFERVTLVLPAAWHQGLHALFAAGELQVRALGESLPIADRERIQMAKSLLHAGFLELARDA